MDFNEYLKERNISPTSLEANSILEGYELAKKELFDKVKIGTTELIKLSNSDYNMLKEKGKSGERGMHLNGYVNGSAQGYHTATKQVIDKACEWVAEKIRITDYSNGVLNTFADNEAVEAMRDYLEKEFGL